MRAGRRRPNVRRAKIKEVHEQDPAGLCCAASIQAATRCAGRIIELESTQRYDLPARCPSCGFADRLAHYRVVGQPYQWIYVSQVWLDEGEA